MGRCDWSSGRAGQLSNGVDTTWHCGNCAGRSGGSWGSACSHRVALFVPQSVAYTEGETNRSYCSTYNVTQVTTIGNINTLFRGEQIMSSKQKRDINVLLIFFPLI